MSDEDRAIEVAAELLPAPAKNKGGRPSLLTVDVQKQIVASIHAGAYPYQAAVGAGVSSKSYERWMRKGKTESELAEEQEREPNDVGKFYNAVMKARALARVAAEIAVKKEHPLAWLMKGPGRERPGEPGWSDKVELTGPNGGPVQHAAAAALDVSKLTTEELDVLDAILAKASAAAASQ